MDDDALIAKLREMADDFDHCSTRPPEMIALLEAAEKIERLEVLVRALSAKLAIYELVAPMIDEHLARLEMDTEEDRALLDKLLTTWMMARGKA